MPRRLSCLLLTCVCTTALLGEFAVPAGALATPTATTGSASNVSVRTAKVDGTLTTNGVSVAWQFQYGLSSKYEWATPAQTISAGQTAPVSVSAELVGLSPFTTYHYRLAVTWGNNTRYYPLESGYGADLTFTTKSTGRLVLTQNVLLVRHDRIAAGMRCVSRLVCRGKLSLDTRARLAKSRSLATVVCAVAKYSIHRRSTGTVELRLRSACLALLQKAKDHRILGKLTSYARTGQRALVRTIAIKS